MALASASANVRPTSYKQYTCRICGKAFDSTEILNSHKEYEQEVLKTQYNKLSDDWRHFNNIIWGVPSAAVAIMAGVIIAAYRPELEGLPRVVALTVGSLFLFALTTELVKKRLHMNAISFLLKDLQVALELSEDFRFPLGSKRNEIKDSINKSIERGIVNEEYKKDPPEDYKDRLFRGFERFYARKYLTYVIFVAAVAIVILAVVEAAITISKEISVTITYDSEILVKHSDGSTLPYSGSNLTTMLSGVTDPIFVLQSTALL